MKREQISKIISNIDSRQVAEAFQFDPDLCARAPERIIHMKKRIITIALAAVLMLALGATAYAAGWLSPIFHKIRYVVPDAEDRRPGREAYYAELEEKNSVMEAAEQYMNDQQPAPETVKLSGLDNCEITLSERYYNGKTLLLGIRLKTETPEFAAVYEGEEDIRSKVRYLAFAADGSGKDDIDELMAAGLPQLTYDDIMKSRTENAIKYGLHNVSAIVLDSMLIHELSPAEYETAWKHLLETGHLCVVQNHLFVSDGIMMEDGTDLGQTYSLPVTGDDPSVRSGNTFIEVPELPESALGLDRLDILLKVRNVKSYYYMELEGSARYYTEPAGEQLVPFSIENSGG